MYTEIASVTNSVINRTARAFQSQKKLRIWFLVYPIAFAGIGVAVFLEVTKQISVPIGETSVSILVGIVLIFTLAISSYQTAIEQKDKSEKIKTIEAEVRENPEKTRAAWDLAQEKLENYLDRNLEQVRSIYWLCLIVMGFGFILISYGAFLVYSNESHLSASILSATSGIIVSFLGGSFIFIYKSTLNQAKEYVTMLERINAVGMSLQILDSLGGANSELKDKAKAEVARDLLKIYGKNT